jgi:hypothetical protein
VDSFVASRTLKDVVAQIVAPGDTSDQRLRKIYAAVMNLENTDFTRERTKAENKAEKVKIKDVSDIWKAQRGNGNEMTLLFIAMARGRGAERVRDDGDRSRREHFYEVAHGLGPAG